MAAIAQRDKELKAEIDSLLDQIGNCRIGHDPTLDAYLIAKKQEVAASNPNLDEIKSKLVVALKAVDSKEMRLIKKEHNELSKGSYFDFFTGKTQKAKSIAAAVSHIPVEERGHSFSRYKEVREALATHRYGFTKVYRESKSKDAIDEEKAANSFKQIKAALNEMTKKEGPDMEADVGLGPIQPNANPC